MKLSEYQLLSKRTIPKNNYGEWDIWMYSDADSKMNICNYAMGLAGESGEVVDLVKKQIHHGHSANREKVKGELGDVLHYVAGLATMYGLSLDEVATYNIEKLAKRYPQGFSSLDSIKRVDTLTD